MTLDSWVRPFSDSNASGFSLSAQTPWMMPVPSRNIGNSNLPDSRRLYSQPFSVTSCPSYWPAFSIVIVVIVSFSDEDSNDQFTKDEERQDHVNGRFSRPLTMQRPAALQIRAAAKSDTRDPLNSAPSSANSAVC